ncbi:MAG: hypothetical protein WC608_03520 [Parcubacteria group bacterium]
MKKEFTEYESEVAMSEVNLQYAGPRLFSMFAKGELSKEEFLKELLEFASHLCDTLPEKGDDR